MAKHIIVVGGGASGLTAAIQAAGRGAHVTVLEHMDRVGKKILSTGNGKCNMTNLNLMAACYRSDNPGFPMDVIRRFPVEDTLEFFAGLGILPKDRGGYIYPNSEQASAVLDALRMEADHLGVETVCGCHVKAVRPGRSFEVLCVQKQENGEKKVWFTCDVLILSTGSRAAPSAGSDGSGYELAKSLGHRMIRPLPALVQLVCEGKDYKALAGIRTEARLTLFADGMKMAEDRGELQLTDYGISGIPTFQISRYAAKALDKRQEVAVMIDFLPSMGERELEEFLFSRRREAGYRLGEDFLTGVLNKKLAAVLMKHAGIPAGIRMSEAKPEAIKALCGQIHSFRAAVRETKPFANAQICCGGVDTKEICSDTMESKIVPGMYLTGELLDVDGICGGYNLQWAWSSGSLAGIAAAGKSAAVHKKTSGRP